MDPTSGTVPDDPQGDRGEPSPEDVRAFVEQLRSTPAEEIIAEVFSTLLTAAEVKLGRRDARLFIDLCAAMSQHAGGHVSDELAQHVEKVLGQLRLSQVGAENQRAENVEPEPNDLSRVPTPPPADAHAQAPTPSAQPPSSRLWVPGR